MLKNLKSINCKINGVKMSKIKVGSSIFEYTVLIKVDNENLSLRTISKCGFICLFHDKKVTAYFRVGIQN